MNLHTHTGVVMIGHENALLNNSKVFFWHIKKEKTNVLNMQNTSPYMVWISFNSNMMNKTQHGKKRSKVAR